MKKIHSVLLGAIAAAIMSTSPALGHEAHHQNMTDAEMAQMEAAEAMEGQMDGHMDGQVAMDVAPQTIPSQRSASPDSEVKSVESHVDGGHAIDDHAAADHATEAGEMHSDVAAPVISPEEAMMAAMEANRIESPTDLLGRFHPVLAHFPIALLLLAAFTELALIFRPALGVEPTIRFLVAGGAIGAVAAAILGWFAAGWRLADRSETLAVHRWTGSGIALVSLFAMWLAFRGGNRTALRVTLAVLAAAIVVQGYYGGEMVFGPNHMGMF